MEDSGSKSEGLYFEQELVVTLEFLVPQRVALGDVDSIIVGVF